MTYTSDQYQRDKRAMLGELNKAMAAAAKLLKPATSVPADSGTAGETREAAGDTDITVKLLP